MDASMLTRFTFYDLQSVIEPILNSTDVSPLLDSHSNDLQSNIEPLLHPMDASMPTRFAFYDL